MSVAPASASNQGSGATSVLRSTRNPCRTPGPDLRSPQDRVDRRQRGARDGLLGDERVEARLERTAQSDHLCVDRGVDHGRLPELRPEACGADPRRERLGRRDPIDQFPVLDHHRVDEVERDVAAEEEEAVPDRLLGGRRGLLVHT
jgi:hypothetical protein